MSSRLKIELIRACVSEKSKSGRRKLQKVHLFKRLTSGVISFSLQMLSLNKHSSVHDLTRLLVFTAELTSVPEKTLGTERSEPALHLLAWREMRCLFLFKLVEIRGIRVISSGDFVYLILLKLSVASSISQFLWLSYLICCLLITVF